MKIEIGSEQTDETSNNSITAILILEEWLKILTAKKKPTKVNINIASGKNFEMNIADDSEILEVEEFYEDTLYLSLLERIQYKNGSIDLSVTEDGKNRLKIILPYRHN